MVINDSPHTVEQIPSYLYDEILIRLKMASGIPPEKNVPVRCRLETPIAGKVRLFHCSIFPVGKTVRVNIRLHREFTGNPPGMPQETSDYLYQAMNRGSGLVIVAGSRGSGRSTTVETLVRYLDKKPVLMLEDRQGPDIVGADRMVFSTGEGPGALNELTPHVLSQEYHGLTLENMNPADLPALLLAARAGLGVAATFYAGDAASVVETMSAREETRIDLANHLMAVLHQSREKVECECHNPNGCKACRFTGVSATRCRFSLLVPSPSLRDSLRRGLDPSIISKDCRESILTESDNLQ